VASLLELQHSFAAALRDPDGTCAVVPAANLAIYRNNALSNFRNALAGTFPVIVKRVGEDFFRQLAHHYRARFPSRSGDLHWIGRDFAAFLEAHLAGGEYAWLADLARLEWAHAEVSIATGLPAASAEVLATFAAEQLESLVFVLQPTLRLVSSSYPVFSVWLANQAENAPPVGQSIGSECGMIRQHANLVEVARLPPDLFSYLSATSSGARLGAAMSAAQLDGPRLAEVLGFVFANSLVSSVTW
jgi:hypothetical protein